MSVDKLFETGGKQYGQFRPHYPNTLIEQIVKCAHNHHLLWDCATGTGQAACALAPYFSKVIATDSSASQVKAAVQHPKVQYKVAQAKASGLDKSSVDCISIAQALHWFADEDFFQEAKRVAKPTGVICAWCYATATFRDQAMNQAWHLAYEHYLKPYFEPERAYVENHYQDIPFPFSNKKTMAFSQSYAWPLKQFLQYVQTFSACKSYQKIHNEDPVHKWIKPQLLKVHNDLSHIHQINFPISLYWGRIK